MSISSVYHDIFGTQVLINRLPALDLRKVRKLFLKQSSQRFSSVVAGVQDGLSEDVVCEENRIFYGSKYSVLKKRGW